MRKKHFFITILFLSLTTLLWCQKSEQFQYDFDNFYSKFDTQKEFELNKDELEWLWYKLLDNSIVKIYSQKNATDFNESIIITKKNSDKSIEEFAKEDIENIDISWFKPSKWKMLEIKCESDNYNLLYYQWKQSMNQYTIYLTYWFMKNNNEIYIISYATLDEKSRNDFSSSFKNIKCK